MTMLKANKIYGPDSPDTFPPFRSFALIYLTKMQIEVPKEHFKLVAIIQKKLKLPHSTDGSVLSWPNVKSWSMCHYWQQLDVPLEVAYTA